MGLACHVMKLDGINGFFVCWYRFTKIKSWSKIYRVGWSKNGCGQSGHGTLKSAVSSILSFLHAGTNSGKLKVDSVIFACQKWHWPFSLWSPKIYCILTLSWQRPLSYRNQSFDLLCKSRDWFLYDNGLRHERVKNEYMYSADYLNADNDAVVSGYTDILLFDI